MGLFGGSNPLRTWWLADYEVTGKELHGQFPAEDMTRTVGATWAEASTPTRQNPIHQFVRGNAETISFKGMLFAETLFDSVVDDLDLLISWTKIDPELMRPPILAFWLGDAHLRLRKCFIETISGIVYGEPRGDGSLHSVSFEVTLKEFVPWSLLEMGAGESRYHHAKFADYYEMVCFREYGDPMLGDVIRKRNPTNPNLATGDIIKLPSIGAIRTEVVEQKSLQLANGYTPKDTPQRRLRLSMFDLRNRSFLSHVVLE